ncbi:protein-glucosylgalactosylhydroxylysine glucosidase-like [Glandiceps talaboti]
MLTRKEIQDVSLEQTIYESTELPLLRNGEIDTRYMPSVGNGHIATVIYSNSTYINGVYNGKEGFSHRARLPSKNAIRVHFDEDVERELSRRYRLNVRNGVWQEVIQHPQFAVTVNIYAHQYFTRLLVTQVEFSRTTSRSDDTKNIQLKLEQNEGKASQDFLFDEPKEYIKANNRAWQISGTTIEPELSDKKTGDSPKISVYVYYTDMPREVEVMAEDQDAHIWTYVTSVDQDQNVAKRDFDDAMTEINKNPKSFLEKHSQLWERTWEEGGIEVDDLKLGKYIYGSFYYILSSLPALHETNQPKNQFFGLSPGGLANGANATDYQGHSFWDTETWMYPPMLMFYPEHAKDILSYRWYGREAARKRAKENGHSGTRYPWESAFTGAEVTPRKLCMACRENEQHITSDIAFAARQYFSATQDMKWLKDWGREFVYEMANFWQSRVTQRKVLDAWEIKGVMCPDEYAKHVDNSFYTNVGASQTISFAQFLQCMAGDKALPMEWQEKGKNLIEVIDTKHKYHPEHEHYYLGTSVKQADVILTGFPLMWPTKPEIRKNDLDIYESATDSHGPAMTWGMFAVGHLELGQYAKAADLFQKSYAPYVREPFKVWTEARSGMGAVNFITGMGGFLQAVMFGYGGFRLHIDKLNFDPVLPPNINSIKFKNLNYIRSNFDFVVDANTVRIVVGSVDPQHEIKVRVQNGTEVLFEKGKVINLTRSPGTIYSTKTIPCDLPADRILKTLSVDSSISRKAPKRSSRP